MTTPISGTTVGADASGVKYQSTSMYAQVGPGGVVAYRHGVIANEPPSPRHSVEVEAKPGTACVVVADSAGYRAP